MPNLEYSVSSFANAFTTRMPCSDSFRWVWNRAHFCPTRWNICDIGFQKKAPMPMTMGTGAKMHAAKYAFVQNRKAMMPTSVKPFRSR